MGDRKFSSERDPDARGEALVHVQEGLSREREDAVLAADHERPRDLQLHPQDESLEGAIVPRRTPALAEDAHSEAPEGSERAQWGGEEGAGLEAGHARIDGLAGLAGDLALEGEKLEPGGGEGTADPRPPDGGPGVG